MYNYFNKTRLHSSRMRTARLLPVSSWGGGMSGPGGCLVPGAVSGLGVSGPGGCLVPGGIWSRGVSGPWRGGIPACNRADPPVYRILDTRY